MKAAQYLKFFMLFLCFIGIQSNIHANDTECNDINRLYSTDMFITKWTTSADNTQITFPLYFSSGTLTIDWGDGTVESNLGEAPTHTYTTAGTYTVTVLNGHIDRIRFSLATGSKEFIVDIMQWGTNTWTSMEYAFKNCNNLDVTAQDRPDLSNVIKTANMFDGCSSLVGTTVFNTWDTSYVRDMFAMFRYCALFNQDIGNWNVSLVDEMRHMFSGAIVFNKNISTWNVSNAKRMGYMFAGATAFNQPLNNWNVSNVDNMYNMFGSATNFNQPLNNWNVSNVENMTRLFFNATKFNQPLDNWDTSKVTEMHSMFRLATDFDQSLGSWDLSSLTGLGLTWFYREAGISIQNYDNTLISWNTDSSGVAGDNIDDIPSNITLDAGSSNYCLGTTDRLNLINTYTWIINDSGESCPTLIVPDVVGLSQTDAETILINTGLQVSVTEVYSTTIAAGTVISQNPFAETPVAFGTTINIVVSLGNYPLILTGIVANNPQFLHVVELYVVNDIPDLSIYAIGVDNTNDGSDGQEFYLSGSATAGSFLYITLYPDKFQEFFGFAPDFDLGGNNGLNPSGDDAIELFYDDNNTPVLIDSYGNVGENGSNTTWEYNRTWVYRKTGTGPDGGFVINNWRIPGPDLLSGSNLVNNTLPVPFPTGTYGLPYDDIAPTAVCQDINFEVDQGNTTVDPSLIDNGSSDNVGIAFMKLDDAVYNCLEEGINPVELTVYDAAGNKATCTATINVTLAASQVLCQDINVSLSFNGEATVEFFDISTGFEGACVSEGAQFFVSTANPGDGSSSGLFDGATTTNSPTDDVMASGNAQYYQEFSFTVPEDGNYLPNFNFSSSTTDDLLFTFISNQPVAANTGDAPSRSGFLDGFVYQAPSSYLGSFSGNDDVFLSAGTTYYLQAVVINQNDSSLLSTATYTGGFGGTSQNSTESEHTYSSADLGENTLYAIVIDDIGRMSYCAATVTITNVDPFITTWKTDNTGTSNDNQITLPTTDGGYNFDVDWGDGNLDYGVGGSLVTHTYATPGIYTVSITGDFPRMHFDNGGDKRKLLSIEKWGDIQWSSMEEAFDGCENLTIAASAGAPDLSNVTSMKSMFEGCEVMNSDLSSWDVSNVTSMREMFYYASAFNGNISNWDVSNVTTLSYMFYEALDFNQPLNSWNTSNVIDMEGVFSETESFNQDLNNWNVSNVTSMYEMFDAADVFNGDVSTWNVSNVEDMQDLFDSAYSFNQDISNWNVSKVEGMTGMFKFAEVFNQDISGWNVGAVTQMKDMFKGANAFNQDIGNWNVSNVTNMANMFQSADVFDQNLENWDIGNIVDTGSSSSGLRNMFGSGPSGVTLSVFNYDDTLLGWNSDSSGNPNDGIDDIPSGIIFSGGKSNYCDSESARQNLIDTYGWSISDNGKDCPLQFQAKVYLQGPSLNANSGILNLMRDDLRSNNQIPTTSPYDGITTCDPSVFSSTDEEAIVDWVEVELRDATDNTNIIHSQSCLIQRDGFIVSTDLSILTAPVPEGDYFVVIKHRNHLGIMSATTISLNKTSVTQIDFTDGTVPTYGTNAQTSFGMPSGVLGMWAGNVNNDTIIQYSGVNPDGPDILSVVLNDAGNILNLPTFTVAGYNKYDINLDGNTQYSGTDPDTPFILQNVLAHPGNFLNFSTYQIIEQLPENE